MTHTRRAFIAALFAVLSFVSLAEAQDVALRFYVVEKTGTGATPMDSIRPKYIGDLGIPYNAREYGRENTYLVGVDVTAAQHTALAANTDVLSIPQNLDSTIGLVALSTVKDGLRSLHIPGGFLTRDHTWRQVVSIVARACLYMQTFNGRQLSRFFTSGITLDTRVNQLTTAQRNAMVEAAQSMGLDTSVVTSQMTLETALLLVFQQIPPFSLAGQTF
jgi:hypothetical protein